jgi:hypothetical protein
MCKAMPPISGALRLRGPLMATPTATPVLAPPSDLPHFSPPHLVISKGIFALWHLDKYLLEFPDSLLADPIEFIIHFLPDGPIKTLLSTVKKDQSLPTCSSVAQISLNITRALRDLPIGHQYLMRGGWTGKIGHEMLYLFERQSNGHFTIYIFNTGAGLNYHDKILHEHKEFCAPIEVIENVTATALCLHPTIERSPVIERLVGYCHAPRDIEVNEIDVYERAFGYLPGRRSLTFRSDDFKTRQRGPTCSMTVWKPFLAFTLKEPFELWKSRIDWWSIASFYAQNKASLSEDSVKADEMRLMLALATKDHLLSLSKRIEHSSGSSASLPQELEEAKKILKDLEETEIALQKTRLASKRHWPIDFTPSNFRDFLGMVRGFASPLASVHPLCASLSLPQFDRPAPTNLLSLLTRLRTAVVCRETPNFVARAMVESFTESLALPENSFWEKVPEENLQEVSKLFLDLLEAYATLTLPMSYRAEEHNTALHLFSLLYVLARRFDRGLHKRNFLDGYGVYIAIFEEQVEDRFLLFFTEAALARRMNLLRFLKGLPSSNGNLCHYNADYLEISRNTIERLPDYLLLSRMMARSRVEDELKKAIEEADRSHPTVENGNFTRAAVLLRADSSLWDKDPNTLAVGRVRKGLGLLQLFGGYYSTPTAENPAPFHTSMFIHEKTWWLRNYFGHKTLPLVYVDWRSTVKMRPLHRLGKAADGIHIIPAATREPLARRVTTLPSESKVLVLFEWSETAKLPFDRYLARTQVEPSLQTDLLLFFFEKRFSLLCDADEATLFELMLFKPIHDGSTSSIPLLEELQRSPRARQSLTSFLERGLSFLCNEDTGKRFPLYGCLVLTRVALRVNATLEDHIFDPLPYLNSWLLRKDLSIEELSLTHLHKVIAFSTLKRAYIPAELKEIFLSWIVFRQQSPPPEWKEIDLEAIAARFIYEHIFKLQKACLDPNFSKALCDEALIACGLEVLEFSKRPHIWTISFPHAEVFLGDGNFWRINLLTAEVSSRLGLLHPGSAQEVREHADYKRLFGKEEFPLRSVGAFFIMQHPRYGKIQMQFASARGGSGVPLRIYWEKEGSLYQYIPTNLLEGWLFSSELPLSLAADHNHWSKLNTDEVLIDPRYKQDPVWYTLTDKGIVTIQEDGASTTIVTLQKSPLFSAFEKDLLWVYEASREPNRRVHLDRFRASGNGPLLSFTVVGTKCHWDQAPAFYLAEEQRGGVLPFIPNYLLLTDGTETGYKILVPGRPILSRQEPFLTHHQELDVKDANRQREYREISRIAAPQRGVYNYFVYNVVFRETEAIITPVDLEGRIFLAYLCLTQRDYRQASRLLRESFPTSTFSATSLNFLRWILQTHLQAQDGSGSNAAVRLQAFLLLRRIHSNPHNTLPRELTEDERKLGEELCTIYFNQHGSIPKELQVEEDMGDKAELKKFLPISSRYHIKLTTGIYPEAELAISSKTRRSLLFLGETPASPMSDLEWCFVSGELRRNGSGTVADLFYKSISFSSTQTRDKNTLVNSFGYWYTRARASKSPEEVLIVALTLDCLPLLPDKQHFDPVKVCLYLVYFALWNERAPPLPRTEASFEDYIKWAKKTTESAASPYAKRFEKEVRALLESPRPVQPRLALTPRTRLTIDACVKRALTPSRVDQRPSAAVLCNPTPFTDQILTKKLVKKYFGERGAPEEAPVPLLPIAAIPKCYEGSKKAVDREIALWKAGVGKAEELKKRRRLYTLERDSLDDLAKALTTEEAQCKATLARLEQEILTLSGTSSPVPEGVLLKDLLIYGGALPPPEMERLVNIWMLRKPSAYVDYNPHILDPSKLDRLLTEYLSFATNRQQIRRGLALLRPCREDSCNPASVQALGEALVAGIVFDSEVEEPHLRALRVLEWRSDIRIREEQAALLKKLLTPQPAGQTRYSHAIAQMIMGGGKTSVLAATLLWLSAQQGKLPIFIAPPAHLATLTATLPSTLHTSFSMPFFSINLPRSKMSDLRTLKWCLETVEEAKGRKGALLINPVTLRYLQLEYFVLLDAEEALFRRGASDANRLEKIDVLSTILQIIRKEAAVLVDEMDVVFAPSFEVNCPTGQPKYLDEDTVSWLGAVFEIMTDTKPLLPDGLSLATAFDLRNETRSFDPSYFETTLLPVLLDRLATVHSDRLMVTEAQKASFVRYASGKMSPLPIDTTDAAFMSYLKALAASTSAHAVRAARLMALTKYLGTKVLSLTLAKRVGMDFGLGVGDGICDVVPFAGPDAPTTNRFGNPIEAAIYYFLTVLATGSKPDRGIQMAQIRLFFEELEKTARHNLELDPKATLDDSPESLECFELTGFFLSVVLQEDNLSLAADRIRTNIPKVLQVAKALVTTRIDFYPSYYRSSCIQLVENVSTGDGSGSSVHTMSGTPSNRAVYAPRLSEMVVLDEGSEGLVAVEFLKKAQRNPRWIHAVSDVKVTTILRAALKEREPAPELRCLIDAAGLLKDEDVLAVARTILETLDKRSIETVLFFGQAADGSGSDCLMSLTRTDSRPVCVGSTAKAHLVACGIKEDKCFTFYDQRHSEAVDIPQTRGAVALLTVNDEIDHRTLLQAIMRMRGFVTGEQTVEVIVHRPQGGLEGVLPIDILNRSCVTQAVRVSKNALRVARYDLENAVHQLLWTKLLEAHDRKQERLFQFGRFNPYLRTTTTIDLLQLLDVEVEIETLLSLTNHSRALLQRVASVFPKDSTEHKEIQKRHKAILDLAGKCPYMPAAVFESTADPTLGTEVSIAMHVEVENSLSTDLAVDLAQELEQALTLGVDSLYIETPWQESFVSASTFPKLTSGIKVEPLSEKLKKCPHYKYRYGEAIFSPAIDLLATDNWAYSTETVLPVFHRAQKPAEQILVVVRGDKVQLVILSVKEAAFFKERSPQADMWLIHPDGRELTSHVHCPLSQSQAVAFEASMLFIYLLNGDIRSLNRLEAKALPFIRGNPLAMRFLKLRVHSLERGGDPGPKNAFYKSRFAGKEQERLYICSSRRKEIDRRTSDLATKPSDFIARLPADEVQYLPDDQIKHLTTKAQVHNLDLSKVRFLDPVQVQLLTDSQIPYLVSADQINALTPDKWPLLLDKLELIRLLNPANVARIEDSYARVLVPHLAFAQVPSVSARHLVYLQPYQLQGATVKQMACLVEKRGLTELEIPGFTKKEQVVFIVDWANELAFLAIEAPEGESRFDPCAHLTEAQWGLVPEKITSDLSALYVPKLPENCLILLTTRDQVGAIPTEKVKFVTVKQIPFLPESKFPHLVTAEQINALPKEKWLSLKEAPKLFALLSDENIPKIPNEAAATIVPHLTLAQTPFVPKEYAPHLNETQLGEATAPQIGELISTDLLTNEKILAFKKREQIEAIVTLGDEDIRDAHTAILTDEQLGKVSEEIAVQYLKGDNLTRWKKQTTPPVPAPQENPTVAAEPKKEPTTTFGRIWIEWLAVDLKNDPVSTTIRKTALWVAIIFSCGTLLLGMALGAYLVDFFKKRALQKIPPRPKMTSARPPSEPHPVAVKV